jgi:hypothetical protein
MISGTGAFPGKIFEEWGEDVVVVCEGKENEDDPFRSSANGDFGLCGGAVEVSTVDRPEKSARALCVLEVG